MYLNKSRGTNLLTGQKQMIHDFVRPRNWSGNIVLNIG